MMFQNCRDSYGLQWRAAEGTKTEKEKTPGTFFCLERVAGICGSQPCLNGGTCSESGAAVFQCQCRPRFAGARCEVDTEPCASSPCLHGGRCVALRGGGPSGGASGDFRCECPVRLSGKRCQYGRHCNPNPCRNGGLCEEGGSGPICKV